MTETSDAVRRILLLAHTGREDARDVATAVASSLTAQGLVERTPGEGRRIAHHLTPAGSAMLEAGTAVSEGFLAQTFAPLDASEREVLYELLNRLGG